LQGSARPVSREEPRKHSGDVGNGGRCLFAPFGFGHRATAKRESPPPGGDPDTPVRMKEPAPRAPMTSRGGAKNTASARGVHAGRGGWAWRKRARRRGPRTRPHDRHRQPGEAPSARRWFPRNSQTHPRAVMTRSGDGGPCPRAGRSPRRACGGWAFCDP